MSATPRIAGSANDPIEVTPSSRPIDLAHLTRQTMNDRTLEQEVLQLFIRQARAAQGAIAQANPTERFRIAHTLKGSARGIGAFALADCLAQIEEGDQHALKALPLHIDHVCDFAAAIGR